MGESEGKSVGQWFGPNTIAQVLKLVHNCFEIFGKQRDYCVKDWKA